MKKERQALRVSIATGDFVNPPPSLDAWLKEGQGPFSVDELKAAFDLIKNPEHWKMDIDTVIEARHRDLVERAIGWFCGGGDIAFLELPEGKLRVVAEGYWTNGMEG